MTKGKSCLLLTLAIVLSLTMMTFAAEPNNIGDILKGNGFDWLFGKWAAITDANQKIEAEFELEVNGYAISIVANTESNEHVGLAYYSPTKKTILYSGVDNAGRVFAGPWEIKGNELVINLEQTKLDGSVTSFLRYLSKVDADTMKSVTYSVVDGKRSEEPIGSLVFKREK
ncbi:MAG: hypothetical protein ABSB11_09460 [Sedimentisphaerales bacterium]|jgi:hypothetical protein